MSENSGYLSYLNPTERLIKISKIGAASIQARLAQIRRFDLFAELAKTYLRTKTPHSPANWQKYCETDISSTLSNSSY
jgi:hypothetical protein